MPSAQKRSSRPGVLTGGSLPVTSRAACMAWLQLRAARRQGGAGDRAGAAPAGCRSEAAGCAGEHGLDRGWLGEGRSVLVVANRVAMAQRLFRELAPAGDSAVLLHSRFRY